MESKSYHRKSSETDFTSGKNKEKTKNTHNASGNANIVKTTNESSCQTEFDEILRRQLDASKEELEQEREEMEKEFTEEKYELEIRLKNEYTEIIKAKDELIRVLTEEKNFFWSELNDFRKSFDLFTKHVHRDVFHQVGLEKKNELGTKPKITGNVPSSCHDSNSRDNEGILTVLRKQEENLLGLFEREKAALTERFQQEKIALRKVVENECESKYAFERAYLLHSIEGLKEGLDSLKIQKHELAKIFEGEKNALELSFQRKEDELRQNLKLELQRKIIDAQKPWVRTKI